MEKQISPKLVSLTFGILILVFAVGFYIFAWTEPTAAPPAENASTSINVGVVTQYKSGALGIGGVFQADSLVYTATSTYLATDGGKVGIGTAIPAAKLDVAGTVKFGGIINTDNNWISGDGGAEGIYIADNGNVGVGTNNPTYKFEVVQPADSVAFKLDSESTGAVTMATKGKFAAEFQQDVMGGLGGGYGMKVWRNLPEAGNNPLVYFLADNTADTQTTLKVRQDGSGDIINLFDGTTEVFTVLNGGNVGIGTPNPTQKLDVVGNIAASNYPPASCDPGSSIRVINATGSVVCQTDTTGVGTLACALLATGLYESGISCNSVCTGYSGTCVSAFDNSGNLVSCGAIDGGYPYSINCHCCKIQ